MKIASIALQVVCVALLLLAAASAVVSCQQQGAPASPYGDVDPLAR